MPQDIHDDQSTLHRSPPAMPGLSCPYVVVVEKGPEQGKRYELDPSQPVRALIGSSPTSTIRLSDRQVSRRHAALEFVGPLLHLVDLGSTNGTWIGGTRIVEVIIGQQITLQVGESVLSVQAVPSRKSLPLPEATRFGRVIGGSMAMRRIFPLCERLAASSVPVLIEGETGTGKELLAESLHEQGERSTGPFVVFDCSAAAPTLVESQLFGHERGAFTGAAATRRGVFEMADGGTLFIDEVGELELPLQARLLRAIERGEVCRVGGERWQKVDVRIVAATRRDLDREVQDGRFRDDLFFRLAVTRIELPPLRHRHGDIGRLSRYFWDTIGGANQAIPYELFERFEQQPWPGNVRELRNAVARRVALGDFDEEDGFEMASSSGNVSRGITGILNKELPFQQARQLVVREFERRYVERLIEKYDGDVGRAVAVSGIARRYFNLLRARHRDG